MDRDSRKRTGQDGLAAWATVAATVVAVVVVAGGAWAVTRNGDDSTSPGTTPGTTTASSPSDTPSTATSSPTDDPSTEASPSDDSQPVSWPAACTRAAKQAMSAGLGVVGPAELPQGWTVLGCAFVPGPASWTVDVTSPHGPIRLVQSEGSEHALVHAYLGGDFTQAPPVHVDGTGTWHAWTGPQQAAALSKAFAGSAVVVKGDQSAAYLTGYAASLLTYERAPGGPGDDAGGGN